MDEKTYIDIRSENKCLSVLEQLGAGGGFVCVLLGDLCIRSSVTLEQLLRYLADLIKCGMIEVPPRFMPDALTKGNDVLVYKAARLHYTAN